jgi:hypothetical protein
MRKVADLKKLDKKHLSPETLGQLISGRPELLRKALGRPDLQFLKAQARERRRQLFDAIKYPEFYRKPPEQRPTPEPNMSPYSPMPPGSPMAPGTPQSPGTPGVPTGGMTAAAGLREYIMTKMAENEEEEEHEGAESPEHEAAESLPPDKLKSLVEYIKRMGAGIDDEGFHQHAEGLGVDPHEAEEEIYRLLGELTGGKDDLIPGGLAAGLPTPVFPKDQIAAGTEVELEHTSNPAIAEEIAKDHLVEGADYYKPRLADLEREMEAAVDAGKVPAVGEGTEKVEENKDRKKRDVETLEKKKAFKHGFFMKVAEAGLRPSEFEEIFRHSFEKAAESDAGDVASALTGGAVISKALEMAGGGVKGLWGMGKGMAKLLGIAPLLLAPILGGIAGGSLYYLRRPDELEPEDIKNMERIALYRRLARRARSRTRKEEPEAASVETRGDDAHRNLLPMPSTPTVEV